MPPELRGASPDREVDLESRLRGVLLGTALGDALGLPAEGLSAERIARRFGRIDCLRLLGRRGYVSDDTEQSALVAQALCRFPNDPDRCAADFRRALLGWFLRGPWGIGRATLRACCRIGLGLRPSGVPSAGNGAAMRSAVVGVFFRADPANRRAFARALAEVTHTDARAVAGACLVAEVAAACASHEGGNLPVQAIEAAVGNLEETTLAERLRTAMTLARSDAAVAEAAATLGTSGFVLHTVPFALFCFLRFGRDPLPALVDTVNAGGDTDSIGAIVGAWCGAVHGEEGLPPALIAQLHDGPFGPTHLRALARCLAARHAGQPLPVPAYSPAAALGRNVALLPVILAHGFRRLLP